MHAFIIIIITSMTAIYVEMYVSLFSSNYISRISDVLMVIALSAGAATDAPLDQRCVWAMPECLAFGMRI